MSVHVNILAQEQPIPEELVEKLTGAAAILLKEYGLEHAEVGIILAGDSCLHELNRSYRRVDNPTDVLAFGFLEPEDLAREAEQKREDLVLGDVYISLDRAAAQSREAGHHLRREILLLAVHGLLHLLGFDHSAPAEREAMQKKEEEILRLVG